MTLRRFTRWMVVGSLAAVAAVPVEAQVRNTGTGVGLSDPFWSVDWVFYVDAGNACVTDHTPDCANYSSPSGVQSNATVVTSPPSPPWAPNDGPTSRWIGVSASGNQAYSPSGAGPGDNALRFDYIFTTDLLGMGSITGTLGWDNRLFGYLFSDANGFFPSGIVAPNASWLSPSPDSPLNSGFCRDGDGVFPSASYPNSCLASMSIDFQQGATSISFFVVGDGATDGFRVAGASVPEPNSAILLGAGLLGIGVMVRRKRTLRA